MLKITLDIEKKYVDIVSGFIVSSAALYNPSIETLEDLKIVARESFTLLCNNKVVDQTGYKTRVECTIESDDNGKFSIIYDVGNCINIGNLKNNIVWDLISTLTSSIKIVNSKIQITQNIEEPVYA